MSIIINTRIQEAFKNIMILLYNLDHLQTWVVLKGLLFSALFLLQMRKEHNLKS